MDASYFKDQPPEAFIRLPAVMSLVSLKRSTIYELIKRGRFPAPEKLTERSTAWRVGEVRLWLSSPLHWRPASIRPGTQVTPGARHAAQ